MSNRVLMIGGRRSTIKVSLPGYDVFTAPLSGLAFDAQFANMEIVQRASVQLPFNSPPAPGSVTVYFAAQANVPLCFCYLGSTNESLAATTPYRVTRVTHRLGQSDLVQELYFSVVVGVSYATFSFDGSNGQIVRYTIVKPLAA